MKLSGADILWSCLCEHGVDTVFGYPGGAILPAYDRLLDHPIRHVLVRHEQSATHMADGYARASGRVGVAVATSGPGATNLVTGIATAMMDSIPIVCITGQVPAMLLGSDALDFGTKRGQLGPGDHDSERDENNGHQQVRQLCCLGVGHALLKAEPGALERGTGDGAA